MMNSPNYRLDYKVMWFLMVVILIATSSFMYKFYNVEECPNIVFDISDDDIGVGEMVMFTNKTEGHRFVQWDFGDNSAIETASNIGHAYSLPGEYIIKVKANGSCVTYRRINVQPKKNIVDHNMIPKFAYPNLIEINKKIKFVSLTETADSYEWRFGETGKVDSREKNPTYTYSTPGLKTVSLIINDNDKYIAKRMIHVIAPVVRAPQRSRPERKSKDDEKPLFVPDAPTEWASYDALLDQNSKPEREAVKVLNDQELRAMIGSYSQNMAKGTQFASSFCEKFNDALVVSNGKVTKLPDFLSEIKGKSIKIRDFRTIRGEEGCVMQMIVKARIR